MSDIVVVYPGGAGGNWLGHLIYCLQYTTSFADSPVINYHSSPKGRNVRLTHDVSDKSKIFFNGRAVFNLYLNVVTKFRYKERKVDLLDIEQRFEIYASDGSGTLFFLEEKIDLDWNNIFQHPSLFIEQLYSLLDVTDIKYQKNNNFCLESINNYKKTCVDPNLHFDNWESELWLGWCNGISKHLWQDWPLVKDLDHIKNFLLPKREFYQEFTKPYMIDIT